MLTAGRVKVNMFYEAKASSDMPKCKMETGVRRPGHKWRS